MGVEGGRDFCRPLPTPAKPGNAILVNSNPPTRSDWVKF